LIFFTYFFGKKVLARKFGLIAALTLLSSAFFLILAHVAILDMVLTVFMTCAIYCGFLTHFCKEQNKKYFWLLFYAFMGLGFLAKGLLALAIPLVIIFIYNLVTKTLKDMFNPVNLILGVIIFLALTMPWHMAMYQKYGYYFIREYFLIHHFGRFMGSEYIGRERPLLYFVPVFLLGFMPWTFIFISYIIGGIKKLVAKYKATQGKLKDKLAALLDSKTNDQKVLLFSSISFIVIFLVFSTSSTKLPTYILPVFPFAALLMGYFWWVSDKNNENEKSIYDMTMLLATIFIFLAIGASMSYYFLPHNLQSKLTMLIDSSIVGLYLIGMFLILRSNTKRALSTFLGYFVSMLFIIILAVTQIFTFIYNGGENELVQYSSNLSTIKNAQLVTFDFAVKPSVMINFHDKVIFITDPDFKELDKILASKNIETFVIVKNSNFKDNPEYLQELEKRLVLIKTGERYSLYIENVNERYNNEIKLLIKD
jgi:4-amino-4-deoxy-L-arabinose transferase-like glycosyltransferase